VINRLARWVDDRLGTSKFARSTLDKVFPDHWSFMLGEIALYCFVILVATGVFLTFFFDPSAKEVTYHGSYKALQGVTMSQAYSSTVKLSFDVRAGLVIRQIHHWAALFFLVAIVAHLCRVFFTGAFRRPREINWVVGVSLLALAMFNGFTGYSLPDDLLSGTGLRIAYSVILSVPVAGTWLAFLLFGGEFPSEAFLSRLFVIHVLLVPGIIIGLLGAHMAILWRQKHTQFPGKGRKDENVIGPRLWPTYTVKSIGLFATVAAVCAALSGLVQINPVWLYGPFKPAAVSTAAQPDWYVGWLEGALRLAPPWRLHLFGRVVPEVFVPGAVIPGLTFILLGLWPFIEARVTGDRSEHHLLDRPRDRPVRTAIGVGVLTFYAMLLVAGGQDIIAQKLAVDIGPVTLALKVLVVAVPLGAALLAWKLCHDLAEHVTLDEAGEEGEPPIGPNRPPEPEGEAAPEPEPALAAAGGPGGGSLGGPTGRASPRGVSRGTLQVVAGAAAAIGAVVAGRRRRRR
jgi:ubiquinol-cytochrome c reductase cytochrome b subunit